jgi:hypothetical protein
MKLNKTILALSILALTQPALRADEIFDSFGPNGEFIPFIQWVIENETCSPNLSEHAARFTTTGSYTNLEVTVPLGREGYSCATGSFAPGVLVFQLHLADEKDVVLGPGGTFDGPGTVLATTTLDTSLIPYQPNGTEATFTISFGGVAIGPGEYYVSLHLNTVDATNLLWPTALDPNMAEGGAAYPTADGKWFVYQQYIGGFAPGVMRVEGDPAISSQEVPRLGNPPNPNVFLPGQTSGPVIGSTWDPIIDHATFVPNAISDFCIASLGSANIPIAGVGTLLCEFTGTSLWFSTSPGSAFQVPTPPKSSLVGLSLSTQGASLHAAGITLTNALDIVIGSIP